MNIAIMLQTIVKIWIISIQKTMDTTHTDTDLYKKLPFQGAFCFIYVYTIKLCSNHTQYTYTIMMCIKAHARKITL